MRSTPFQMREGTPFIVLIAAPLRMWRPRPLPSANPALPKPTNPQLVELDPCQRR